MFVGGLDGDWKCGRVEVDVECWGVDNEGKRKDVEDVEMRGIRGGEIMKGRDGWEEGEEVGEMGEEDIGEFWEYRVEKMDSLEIEG